MKNTKLLNKWHFVENKNRACAACLKMKNISLLPKYIQRISTSCYFTCLCICHPLLCMSLATTLMDLQCSQHHTVHRL